MARRAQRRPFGSVRQRGSGRYQVRYTGPDGRTYTGTDTGGRSMTFDSKAAATAYLSRVHADIQAGRWESPGLKPAAPAPLTFAEAAEDWLASREIETRTAEHYSWLLGSYLYPVFGGLRLGEITTEHVETWYARLRGKRPTRDHAYVLLKSVMARAVARHLITENPCTVERRKLPRAAPREPLSVPELNVITACVPPRFRALVLIMAGAGLRFGEATALTRADVDLNAGVVHIRRAVTATRTGRVVKSTKSGAGIRRLAIPERLVACPQPGRCAGCAPHTAEILAPLREHLRTHVLPGAHALLFPAATDGGYLPASSAWRWWLPAVEAAGRPAARIHDLRHMHLTLFARTGATLKEIMARGGHSTPGAALIYQDLAAERDRELAAAMGTVVPITSARPKTPARRPASG